MPYKAEHIRLPEDLDRRRKVTEEQCERMFSLRAAGMSYRRIAAEVGMAKSTVMYTLSPAFRAKCRRYVARNWKRYSEAHKSERNDIMREHRRYKHGLLKAGLINKENEKHT